MEGIEVISGFLILISSGLIREWRGSDDAGQDYDFFCANSDGYASQAMYRGQNIVMFGGEPTSFWWHEDADSHYLVRIINAEPGWEVIAEDLVSSLSWSPDVRIGAWPGELFLMDPACTGDEAVLEGTAKIIGSRDRVSISTAIYQDEKCHLIFHRIETAF